MAYNEDLAQRVQEILSGQPGFVEKKMFGGIGYILYGNMACGVNKDNLIVRVGPKHYEEAMGRPYTSVFDITGKVMKGWVVVGPEGCQTDNTLKAWVQQGANFALSLPPK